MLLFHFLFQTFFFLHSVLFFSFAEKKIRKDNYKSKGKNERKEYKTLLIQINRFI